ncbi:MAG: TolC family protein [Prevotellaceae bacterium]|nr:TolC family protein [Prevotellaceae bacterium]
MTFRKTIPLILFLLTQAAAALPAQTDSLALSLAQLFEQGVAQSLRLRADALKQEAADEQWRAARAAQLPDVQVGARAGIVGQPLIWERGLAGVTRPDIPDWMQNYSLDFQQPIYQGGRLRGTIRKANLERETAQWQTSADRATLKLGLLTYYLNLFTLFKEHEVLTRNIEEAEQRLANIQRMKREGLITDNDVLRSQMQLTNDRLALQETENSITLASQQITVLLGIDEQLIVKPDTTLLHRVGLLRPYQSYIDEAYLNEPEMRLAALQTELARTNLQLSQAALRPGLSLTASNTLARPVSRTLADMYNNNWNIGLSLNYPLSALYKSRHPVRRSRLLVLLQQTAQEQEKQQIRIAVRTAYLRHQEALQRVDALMLSVRQAKENYRIMQNRYLNQLVILTDLLDASTVRLNAELQLVRARTQLLYTYYQLQKICGLL